MTKVHTAKIITTGTKYPEMVSANLAIGAFEFCASCTILTICARAVSLPTLVARNLNAPVLLIVAPMTSSPVFLEAGNDSPVSMDSSTAELPSTMTPSTGTSSPGRTWITSPTSTSSTGKSISLPSRMTRAVLACKPSSFLIAELDCPLARSSSACPKTTNAITTATTSKNGSDVPSGKTDGNRIAKVEYNHAAPVPNAISVFMFAERCLNAAHAPVKKSLPDQNMTGRVNNAVMPQSTRNESILRSRRNGTT